jgi:hypothetical protein
MPLIESMHWRISLNTSFGCVYFQSSPRRLPSSTVIHRSGRASPGASIALRPICTMRSVLVTVPSFSGLAVAGSTTSAR